MDNQTPSPQSQHLATAVALRMVAESRPRMNAYTDETRESLEQEARSVIAGHKTQSLCQLQ